MSAPYPWLEAAWPVYHQDKLAAMRSVSPVLFELPHMHDAEFELVGRFHHGGRASQVEGKRVVEHSHRIDRHVGSEHFLDRRWLRG